jgi:hypothetical protein
MALPTVVLPQPDSPTSASVRPGAGAGSRRRPPSRAPTVRLSSPCAPGNAPPARHLEHALRRAGACTHRPHPLTVCARTDAESPRLRTDGSAPPARRPWCQRGAFLVAAVEGRGTALGEAAAGEVADRAAARCPRARRAPAALAPPRAARRRACANTDAAGVAKKASRGPVSTTCPAYITPTRWATRATTPRSWVISSIAMPSRRWMSASRSSTWAWMVTSSAVVGSSAISRRGRPASAIAIITRCFMPPENWKGNSCSRRSGRGCPPRRAAGRLGARRLAAQAVGGERLDDLRAHAHHRVEAGGGLLEDHADAPAAHPRIAASGSASRSSSPRRTLPAGDAAAVGQQAGERERGHRLAAARFAEQARSISPGTDLEAHPVDRT